MDILKNACHYYDLLRKQMVMTTRAAFATMKQWCVIVKKTLTLIQEIQLFTEHSLD